MSNIVNKYIETFNTVGAQHKEFLQELYNYMNYPIELDKSIDEYSKINFINEILLNNIKEVNLHANSAQDIFLHGVVLTLQGFPFVHDGDADIINHYLISTYNMPNQLVYATNASDSIDYILETIFNDNNIEIDTNMLIDIANFTPNEEQTLILAKNCGALLEWSDKITQFKKILENAEIIHEQINQFNRVFSS